MCQNPELCEVEGAGDENAREIHDARSQGMTLNGSTSFLKQSVPATVSYYL